jgi:hypothetical protein
MEWLVAALAMFLISAVFVSRASASKVMANSPYVTSLGGVFYARAIPDEEKGTKGTTTIYRVRRDQDEVVERHAWYAPGGLHLGWSPIAGKVAAMAVGGDAVKDPGKRVELKFYIGPERLTTYTTGDLLALGATLGRGADEDVRRANMRIVGCEQIQNTNDYVFRVVLHTSQGERTIDFDILTGKPYDAAKAATRPGHR